MKKTKKNWFQRLFSPTPKEWKKIRNQWGNLAGAVTAGWATLSTIGIKLPVAVEVAAGIIIAISTAIATYAQSHELK